jgi:hypothetical protein
MGSVTYLTREKRLDLLIARLIKLKNPLEKMECQHEIDRLINLSVPEWSMDTLGKYVDYSTTFSVVLKWVAYKEMEAEQWQ